MAPIAGPSEFPGKPDFHRGMTRRFSGPEKKGRRAPFRHPTAGIVGSGDYANHQRSAMRALSIIQVFPIVPLFARPVLEAPT